MVVSDTSKLFIDRLLPFAALTIIGYFASPSTSIREHRQEIPKNKRSLEPFGHQLLSFGRDYCPTSIEIYFTE